MPLSPEVTQSPQGTPLLDECLGGKKLWNYRPKAAGHQLLPKSRAEAREVALWAVHAGEGMETCRQLRLALGLGRAWGAYVRLTPCYKVRWHSKAKDNMGPEDGSCHGRRVAAQG